MSIRIGIVCEVISDYRVLKHITERYLRDEDAYVVPLKPKETALGRQDGYGGWQGVLEYIAGEDGMMIEAVREGCRYVIVHIDTDVREQYGVPDKFETPESLHKDVTDKLTTLIHPDFNRTLVIFAIAVHETECWLIPFLTDDRKTGCNIDSCVNRVNSLLKSNGYIDKDNKNSDKARKAYEYILKQKRKAKDIKAASLHNYGFASFIRSLDFIKDKLASNGL